MVPTVSRAGMFIYVHWENHHPYFNKRFKDHFQQSRPSAVSEHSKVCHVGKDLFPSTKNNRFELTLYHQSSTVIRPLIMLLNFSEESSRNFVVTKNNLLVDSQKLVPMKNKPLDFPLFFQKIA